MPFGILCLPAWRIMFVKMMFSECVYMVVVECQRDQPRSL